MFTSGDYLNYSIDDKILLELHKTRKVATEVILLLSVSQKVILRKPGVSIKRLATLEDISPNCGSNSLLPTIGNSISESRLVRSDYFPNSGVTHNLKATNWI